MNIAFFASLTPKTFFRYFKWRPSVTGNFNREHFAWNVDFRWLCFSLQLDNEW